MSTSISAGGPSTTLEFTATITSIRKCTIDSCSVELSTGVYWAFSRFQMPKLRAQLGTMVEIIDGFSVERSLQNLIALKVPLHFTYSLRVTPDGRLYPNIQLKSWPQ